jgi:signal transduction histidine kinase
METNVGGQLTPDQEALQRRVAQTISGLDSMSAELIHMQKMDALGQLAAGVTHDFKNVLQTIISIIDLIDTRADEPEQVHRLTASLMRVAERGVGLTQRLLAFARRQELQQEAVNLPAVMEGILQLLVHALGSNIHIEVEPMPANLWQPFVDVSQLELALLNLGINARDAMCGHGSLRLSAQNVVIPEVDRRSLANISTNRELADERRGAPLALNCGNYILLIVADDGCGMDEETLARAAEPFFTTKRAGKGSGLGLSMVHGFATQHGGTLRLRSQQGKGTSVELWLPSV